MRKREEFQQINRRISEPSTGSLQRYRLQVSGVVQGVGFRPFLHNLARQLQVNGWVRNTSIGVEMEVQGTPAALAQFVDQLQHNAPPLARILDLDTTTIPTVVDQPAGLEIRPSRARSGRTLVSPDVATCELCRREVFDPSDRRAHYAFTNCTHCGPRFTIINDLPYDRPATTMADFSLCEACAREYKDTHDRRFHAQPVACPDCGPTVWYTSVDEAPDLTTHTPTADDALAAAVDCLNRVGVIALKGLGGFHLACRADSSKAITRLRTHKNRPAKPLAVMVRTAAEAENYCQVSPAEAALLTAPEAPIVLLRKRTDGKAKKLAPEISPHNSTIGIMLPYTPLHHLLLDRAGALLVMTSGNRRGEPLCIDNDDARAGLSAYCDGFLFHNRPIARRCDDSVMFVAHFADTSVVQPIRRSRGLAPLPVLLPKSLVLDTPLVAAGADLKTVPALAVERQVFLTQHIGDMDNLKAREEHARAIADFEQFFRIQPRAVVCDLHPGYASTRYARERAEAENLPLIEVQHHYAHIAACLAENNHTGPAIGLSFDGTGLGTDGHIWGSEVLLVDLNNFERRYHLQYLPLPGGDAATRRPYRIALAYLRALLPDLDVRRLFSDVPEWELSTLDKMLAQNLNTPQTSSMGRLFDAVSALLGLCVEATHEAQAAMALENAALQSDFDGPAYPFELFDGEIRLAELFAHLVADHQNGVSAPSIARRFHQTVAEMAVTAVTAVRAQTEANAKRVDQVALSGGVWQNRLLLEMAVPLLEQAGFEVLLHHSVPANDGGLAYGQVAVAAARLQNEKI